MVFWDVGGFCNFQLFFIWKGVVGRSELRFQPTFKGFGHCGARLDPYSQNVSQTETSPLTYRLAKMVPNLRPWGQKMGH